MLNFNLPIYRTFLLVIFYFSIFFSKALGQYVSNNSSYVVKIDSVTKQPDKAIPFDQAFTMVLSLQKPQTVLMIELMPIARDKNGSLSYWKNLPDPITSMSVSGGQLVFDCPPLPPNFTFDLYIFRKLDSTNLNTFLNIVSNGVDALNNPGRYNAAQLAAIETKYVSFQNSFANSAKTPTKILGAQLALSRYDYVFNQTCIATLGAASCTGQTRTIEDYMTSVPRLNNAFTLIQNVAPALNLYGAGGNFLDDLQYISESFRTEKLNDQIINSLIRIWIAGRDQDFINGLISTDFEDQITESNNRFEIIGKQKNFQSNLQKIISLRDTIQKLQNENANFEYDPEFQRVNDCLLDMIQKFHQAQQTIDENVKVITSAFSNREFCYTEYYINNTDGIKDLQSESATRFSPQIGLSCLYVPNNERSWQFIPKLTLGVNFNFRAINKNLIRKDIPWESSKIPDKNLGNYISAYVGITFGGFSDPQYSNLLASNSLLVGLNYRITRNLYYSMGTSIFKQQDKNPIINSYHAQCGIYASLQLDLDFTSAISNVISYVTK
jgi:hypothetical protein